MVTVGPSPEHEIVIAAKSAAWRNRRTGILRPGLMTAVVAVRA
jgi:hypothetical protein